MQPMTIEQALKLLWDASESIRTDGSTRDALRLAWNTLRIATEEKAKSEVKG